MINRFEVTNREAANASARSSQRPAAILARLDRQDDTLVRCGFRTCPGILGHAERVLIPSAVVLGRVQLVHGMVRRPGGSFGLSSKSRERVRRHRAGLGRGDLDVMDHLAGPRSGGRGHILWLADADPLQGRFPHAKVAPLNARVACPLCGRLNRLDPRQLRVFDPAATASVAPGEVRD
ncbi:MAG: hypothetical protein ACREN7_00815 [Candidatus Dormibacteria bacterium]